MPKYNLTCSITVSAYTSVEADSLEEAIEIAEGRAPALDFNGSGVDEDETWCINDADGTPCEIHEA